MNQILQAMSMHVEVEWLGWVLVHSIWQFLLIAVVTALGLRLLKQRSATSRYIFLVLYWLLTMASPFCTWIRIADDVVPIEEDSDISVYLPYANTEAVSTEPIEEWPPSQAAVDPILSTAPSSPSKLPIEAPWSLRIKNKIESLLPAIVIIWLIGVIICSMRPIFGWWNLRRLRTTGLTELPDETVELFDQVCAKLGIRGLISIYESSVATVPMVVGYLRPIVLLPTSLLSTIPADQLEAIFAHELAHVRRHDFVVNLLQTLVETVCFYHPAVWWLSKRIRIEREHCCDDLVVDGVQNREVYARALISIAEDHGSKPSLALGAKDGSLPYRLRRLLNIQTNESRRAVRQQRMWWGASAIIVVIACLTLNSISVGVSAERLAEATQRYKAKLPNGGTIELVGVGFHQATRQDWWQPDGQLLQHAPRDESIPLVRLMTTTAPGKQLECRDFGFRLTGVPRGKQLFAHQLIYDTYAEGIDRVMMYGPTDFRLGTMPRLEQTNAQVVTVRTLFNESPSYAGSFDVEGKKLHEPFEDSVVETADQFIQPIEVKSLKGQSQLLLKAYHRGTTPPVNDYVPEAVSKSGKRYRSIRAGGEEGYFSYLYDISRDQIDHFEYSFYLYDHWIDFKNVSLDPGKRTEVETAFHSLRSKQYVVAKQTDNARAKSETKTPKLRTIPCVIVDAATEKPIEDKEFTIHFRYRMAELKNDKPVIMADWFWGPKSSGNFEFFIPKDFINHPKRKDIVVEWGVSHPDYISVSSKEPVSLDRLINEHPKLAQATFSKIQLHRQRAAAPLERLVSLEAKQLSRRRALMQICDQAGLDFEPDIVALIEADLSLEEKVTVSFNEITFSEALGIIIDWDGYPGVFREIKANRLVLTTIRARQEFTKSRLPEWLKQHYNNGLLARLDEEGNVVSVTASKIINDAMMEKLATLKHLKKLNIEYTENLTSPGIAKIGQMQQLEELTVSKVNDTDKGLGDHVIRSVTNVKTLRTLKISECGTTDAGAKLLEQIPQLTSLSLYQEGRLTDTALESIGKLSNLTTLSLTTYVTTQHYGRMEFSARGTANLAKLDKLESLHLVGHGVEAKTLQQRRLKRLSLGGASVDDECAKRIAMMMNLESLNLSFSSVSEEGLKAIAGLTRLNRISLDGDSITDAGIAHLAKLPRLTYIDMRCPRLTDAALGHLAKAKTLTGLSLHGSGYPGSFQGNRFSAPGLQQLKALPNLRNLSLTNLRGDSVVTALGEIKSLRRLNLMMVEARHEELEQLSDQLPEATIHYMTGSRGEVFWPKRLRKKRPKFP